ncbi:MAG: hypothetical protein ABSE15_06055 [Candidatus Bathyarchaeia archaeon]
MSDIEQRKKDEKIVEDLYQAMKGIEEYQTLLTSLKPLVEALKTSPYAATVLQSNTYGLMERSEKMKNRALLLKENVDKSRSTETTTLRKAFSYLGLFEASVTTLMDLLLMIFIANHHDFYVFQNKAYAKNIDDLNDSSLGEKLVFFNHHGLSLLAQNINKNLRNKVAHMDFDVQPDGMIKIANQTYDLDYEILKLSAMALLITNVLESLGLPQILAQLKPRPSKNLPP